VAVAHVPSMPVSAVDEVAGAGVAGVGQLVGLFARVPDPRKPRGVRHRIAAVLTVTVFAVLTGARNYRQIADAAADLPRSYSGWPVPAVTSAPVAGTERTDDPPGRAGHRHHHR
jgi:hypothetical protein